MLLRKALRSVLFCQKRILFLSVILMLLITMIYYGSSFSLLKDSSREIGIGGQKGVAGSASMLNRVLPPPPPPAANKFASKVSEKSSTSGRQERR